MKTLRTFQGTVYPWHCDHMGHMNVQFYSSMFDQASWNLFSHVGMTTQMLKENNRGMVALEQHITYKRELLPGNNVYIETHILELKEKIITFQHTMFNIETKEIAAESKLTGLHIDSIKRKSISFLPEVYQNIKALAEE